MPTLDQIPYRGSTPTSRQCSLFGAQAVTLKAGGQAARVLAALTEQPCTLQELAALLDLPLATICGRVGMLRAKGLIAVAGARVGRHGVPNAIWCAARGGGN